MFHCWTGIVELPCGSYLIWSESGDFSPDQLLLPVIPGVLIKTGIDYVVWRPAEAGNFQDLHVDNICTLLIHPTFRRIILPPNAVN